MLGERTSKGVEDAGEFALQLFKRGFKLFILSVPLVTDLGPQDGAVLLENLPERRMENTQASVCNGK